jgi:hypothetical protein
MEKLLNREMKGKRKILLFLYQLLMKSPELALF